jgi:hypothetical protein
MKQLPDAWDQRIETDAKAGRLDPLWQQAVKDKL